MNSSVPPRVETRRLFQPPVQSRSVIRCRAFIYLLVFSCLLSQFLLSSFQWARLVGIRALEAADISYVYDELGRLRAVVDPGSDTAFYNYDSVGNLLSITRQSSSVVSIIEFTPDSGPIGTTVTIFGTGFSTTPSQNTVTFNGVSASVTSSTTTQIVATVPTGATTGVIGVTAPGGSATSAAAFTVTASTGAPTITGFTPTIGTPGTTVTVSGTNFEAGLSGNILRFNNTISPVTSGTTTSLNTTVPSVTPSGPISVRTSRGTAVSSADFFIPPPPYTAADVTHMGRMNIGGSSHTVTIGTANKVGMVIFDGVAGQQTSLGVNSSTLGGSTDVYIYKPDGSQLISDFTFGVGAHLHVTLPVNGTYTILIVPFGTTTGSITLTLSEDIYVGSIITDGASVTATIGRVGQRARMTFSGTAAQVVSMGVSSVTMSTNSDIYVYNPDGSTLTSSFQLNTSTNFHMTLPTTGTYTILIDPDQISTGSVTLTLSSEVYAGTIVVDGASVTATTTRVGQRARMTFGGTAGQVASLGVNSITMSTNSDIFVYNPDGSTLASSFILNTSTNFHMTLPATGTYTIIVDPDATSTGSVTLTLSSEVNAGAIVINGGAAPLTISRVGQRGYVTFSGNQSQQATVRITGNTMGQVTVRLLKPDGTQLTSTVSSLSSFNLATQTLPTTGTYTIQADPSGVNTGSMNISVTSP